MEAELDLGSGTANAFLSKIESQQARDPGGFEDCAFGDAGAYDVAEARTSGDAAASSSNMPRQEPGPGPGPRPQSDGPSLRELFEEFPEEAEGGSGSASQPPVPFLPVHGSFASLFSRTERTFSLETGFVKLREDLTEESKTTIAEVFADSRFETRLGTIGCAVPLRETRGLKATCDMHKDHKERGKGKCICWINMSKEDMATASHEHRWRMFRSMVDWLAQGVTVDADRHMESSQVLRMAAGMMPRGFT